MQNAVVEAFDIQFVSRVPCCRAAEIALYNAFVALPAPKTTDEFFRRATEENTLEYKVLLTVFVAVFIAELGDKTQLATMLFAADKEVSKLTVFTGAALALIVASGIGVLAGGVIAQYISEKQLNYIAGIGFIGIGLWTLVKA